MTDMTDKEMKEAMKSVKIGTKEEVFWTTAKRRLEDSILQYTESLQGDKLMLELAEKRIAEEKAKFK